MTIGAFTPKPGETQWWVGDGNQFPVWEPSLPHAALFLRRNVLSREQCKLLVDCFERNREALAPTGGNEYWDGRFVCSAQLPDRELDAQRVMQQVRHLSNWHVTNRFSGGKIVYSDTAQLVRWHAGLELTPHTDNMHPDGRPSVTAHRCYSSILYLNDDYEGGHTFFPGFGIRIRPEPGTLILFGAGPEYVHGITPVISGLRYTYAGWFTYDESEQDCTAQVVY